jgi:ABC-type glutathione transport system ATPase component
MKEITSIPMKDLLPEHPYAGEFFRSMGLKEIPGDVSASELVSRLTDSFIMDCGMERPQMLENFSLFIKEMNALKISSQKMWSPSPSREAAIRKVRLENPVSRSAGEVVCVVGPTGSGKSRLLADIECLAQKDTPTGRQVLINGSVPERKKRFSIEHKLVAQLSQNMNFVMDLSVSEFISMHAESRMLADVPGAVAEIIKCANELAGEPFSMDTSVTQLSGASQGRL